MKNFIDILTTAVLSLVATVQAFACPPQAATASVASVQSSSASRARLFDGSRLARLRLRGDVSVAKSKSVTIAPREPRAARAKVLLVQPVQPAPTASVLGAPAPAAKGGGSASAAAAPGSASSSASGGP